MNIILLGHQDIASLFALNRHTAQRRAESSLRILPDYRGVMATFRAMLNEEPEIGATLHWIVDSGIDTGPEIGISRARTQPEESYLANVLRLTIEGCKMMAAALETLAHKKIQRSAPRAMGQGRYYSTPDAEAIECFLAKGLKLVSGEELALIS